MDILNALRKVRKGAKMTRPSMHEAYIWFDRETQQYRKCLSGTSYLLPAEELGRMVATHAGDWVEYVPAVRAKFREGVMVSKHPEQEGWFRLRLGDAAIDFSGAHDRSLMRLLDLSELREVSRDTSSGEETSDD